MYAHRTGALTSADLARLEQCPAAGCYKLAKREKPGFGQFYGIFVHRFIQYALTRGREYALDYIRTKKLKAAVRCCEQIDIDQLPIGQVEVELAHNVITDTARALAGTTGARSVIVEQEQYSRADLLSRRTPEIPFIVDYKCGDLKGKNPWQSTQLFGIAVAVRGVERDFMGKLRGPAASSYDLGFAGIRSNGSIDWSVARVSNDDLDRFVIRARQVHLRVIEDRRMLAQGHTPEFIRGPECRWCELRHACPAWK